MKLAKGPRPLSIKLFALCFGLAAASAVYLGFSNPITTEFIWANRFDTLGVLGAVQSTQDFGLIAICAMFSIALIPVVWIYVLGIRRARWVVLVFGLCKLALWFDALSFAGYPAFFEMVRMLEPLLITAGLVFLFSRSSRKWLGQSGEHDDHVWI